VTIKLNWQIMVLVTFRFERRSCSKVFCWTVHKISTIYLGHAENRTMSTVKQHDQSLRQVTSVSFVVLKRAAGNFCGCNSESTVLTYFLTFLRISLLSITYLQVLVHASNTITLNKTLKSFHDVCSNPPSTNRKEHSQIKSVFCCILYV
jgi:hypothetical protein